MKSHELTISGSLWPIPLGRWAASVRAGGPDGRGDLWHQRPGKSGGLAVGRAKPWRNHGTLFENIIGNPWTTFIFMFLCCEFHCFVFWWSSLFEFLLFEAWDSSGSGLQKSVWKTYQGLHRWCLANQHEPAIWDMLSLVYWDDHNLYNWLWHVDNASANHHFLDKLWWAIPKTQEDGEENGGNQQGALKTLEYQPETTSRGFSHPQSRFAPLFLSFVVLPQIFLNICHCMQWHVCYMM